MKKREEIYIHYFVLYKLVPVHLLVYIFVKILSKLDTATDLDINVVVIPHQQDWIIRNHPSVIQPFISYFHFLPIFSSSVYWIRVLFLLPTFTKLARIPEATFSINHACIIFI